MLESHSESLVRQFMNMSQPDTYNFNIKFKTQDQTVFEIELSGNGIIRNEIERHLIDVIDHSVASATRAILSAK